MPHKTDLWPFMWRQHWCSVHKCSVLCGEGHCSGGNIITHRHTITHDESFTDEKHHRWRWRRGHCEEFSHQDGSSLIMLSLSSLAQGSSPEDKTSRFSISKHSITVTLFHILSLHHLFHSAIVCFALTLSPKGWLFVAQIQSALSFWKYLLSKKCLNIFKFCLINNRLMRKLVFFFFLFHFICFIKCCALFKKKGNVKQQRLVFRLLTEAQQPLLPLSLQALKPEAKTQSCSLHSLLTQRKQA